MEPIPEVAATDRARLQRARWLAGRFGGLWRHPGFRRLWIGETVSAFGSNVTYLALNLVAVLVLRATPAELGVVIAARTAPAIVTGLVAGVWVDRLRRVPLLIGTNLTAAALLLLIPLAAFLNALSMPLLYVVAASLAVTYTVARPGYNAFVPSLVGRENLVEANAKLELMWSMSFTLGPLLAGVLIQLMSAPNAILVDAFSFVIAGGFLFTLRNVPEEPPPPTEKRDTLREIREGLRLTARDPYLRTIAGAHTLLRLFAGIVFPVYVLFVADRLGEATPTGFGLLTTVGGLGFLLGAAVAPRLPARLGLGGTMVTASALLAISPFFMPLAPRDVLPALALLGLASFIGAVGDVIITVHFSSIRQAIAPNRVLGRVVASQQVAMSVAVLIGGLIGGALGSVVGLTEALWIAAFGHLTVFAWVFRSPMRGLKAIPEPPPRAPSVAL